MHENCMINWCKILIRFYDNHIIRTYFFHYWWKTSLIFVCCRISIYKLKNNPVLSTLYNELLNFYVLILIYQIWYLTNLLCANSFLFLLLFHTQVVPTIAIRSKTRQDSVPIKTCYAWATFAPCDLDFIKDIFHYVNSLYLFSLPGRRAELNFLLLWKMSCGIFEYQKNRS